jgi:hypothetical protein
VSWRPTVVDGGRDPGAVEWPEELADRRTDEASGLPLPFVCEHDDGSGDLAHLAKKRVLQCALSRVCAACGLSGLPNPLVLIGTEAEVEDNGFRLPPLHPECAHAARAWTALGVPVLGQTEARPAWRLVRTGGFDLDRPDGTGHPAYPTFRPHSVVDVRDL